MSITTKLAAVLLGAATLATGGCFPHSGYGGEVYVDAAPPPPPPEVVGVAPYPGAVWIGGHYYPQGRRYVWHPGSWTRARPGRTYVQHRIQRAPNGRYVYRRGHWR